MDGQAQGPTLDSVKSFAEYTGIGMTLAYQLTRAEGFPVMKVSGVKGATKRGRVLIEREAALDWMRKQTAANRR